jgi:putative effector of murein hydrolase
MQALLHHPVLWLTLTVAAYLVGDWLFRRSGCMPLLHPVFVAVALLIPLLKLAGVSYSQYFEGARFIHLLLGPATVALAIPLFSNLARVRQILGPLSVALAVGGATAIASVVLIGKLFGLSTTVLLSFAPKSVTTPIAMALADKLGGNASLAAVAVAIGVVTDLGAKLSRTVVDRPKSLPIRTTEAIAVAPPTARATESGPRIWRTRAKLENNGIASATVAGPSNR